MKYASLALALAVVAATTISAAALDRRVRIINDTSYDIIYFYASNTGTNSWQEDILGRDILPAGYNVVINIDDGTGYCKYDFKAVFEDGEELTDYGINVCEVSSFTYY